MTSKKKNGSTRISVPTTKLNIRAGFGVTVTVTTKYQKRARKVISQIRNESVPLSNSIVARFLFHYFCCEALARILQGEKAGWPLSKTLGKRHSVDLRSLIPALKKLGFSFESARLKHIFEATDGAVHNKSARALRNAIVHGLAYLDIQEVHRRGHRLIEDMEKFISMVEQATDEERRL